jgi:hypothetical protein
MTEHRTAHRLNKMSASLRLRRRGQVNKKRRKNWLASHQFNLHEDGGDGWLDKTRSALCRTRAVSECVREQEERRKGRSPPGQRLTISWGRGAVIGGEKEDRLGAPLPRLGTAKSPGFSRGREEGGGRGPSESPAEQQRLRIRFILPRRAIRGWKK